MLSFKKVLLNETKIIKLCLRLRDKYLAKQAISYCFRHNI